MKQINENIYMHSLKQQSLGKWKNYHKLQTNRWLHFTCLARSPSDWQPAEIFTKSLTYL